MALAIASASRLKPDIRLAQVVSEFAACLHGDQKAAFNSTRSVAQSSALTVGDVMRLTAEIDQRALSKVGGRCFGPRFMSILQAVQQFVALGDIVVGGSQQIIACGVWAVVRMSLLAISGYPTYLDKLSQMFMTVGHSAPRYQNMALLYPRSKDLRSYLSEYFIVVVKMCQEILMFSQKSAIGQLKKSLTDSDIKAFQSQLQLWGQSIKDEVDLLTRRRIEDEAQENSKFRSWARGSRTALATRERLRTRLRWLDEFSLFDYVALWKQIRKSGNTSLFSDDEAFRKWKTRTNSSTLFVKGILGSGKSVLLANVVDDLHLQSSERSVTYFFCRHDNAESLKSRTILGCFARQLLQPMLNNDNLEPFMGEIIPTLDTEGIIELLKAVVPSTRKVYFVLDGADECTPEERRSLSQSLAELQKAFILSLCVSIRFDADNPELSKLEGLVPDLNMSIPKDNPDIGSYIQTELESRVESGRLVVGDPAIVLEIRDKLMQGAKGMFLWVSLQVDCVCQETTDEGIRQALESLPNDLSGTFAYILRKCQKGTKDYQMRILKFLLAVFQPLAVDDYREALSVVRGDTTWNPSKFINNIYGILACCGSLIVIDEEDSTVRLVHHSVRQFLLGEIPGASEFKVTLEDAHEEMTATTVTYLNYGVFETQLSRRVIPRIDPQQALGRIISSSLSSSNRTRHLALRLLKSGATSRPAIEPTLAEASARNTHRLQDRPSETFSFLKYARGYWLLHSRFISPDAGKISKLWAGLLSKMGLQEAVSSLTKSGSSHHGFISVSRAVASRVGSLTVLAAIWHSHLALLRCELRGAGGIRSFCNVVPCLKVIAQLQPTLPLDPRVAGYLLPISIVFRSTAVTNWLLGKGADPSYMGFCSITAACSAGDDDVLRRLLAIRQASVSRFISKNGWPLLQAALRESNSRLVYLLAKAGAVRSPSLTRRATQDILHAVHRSAKSEDQFVKMGYDLIMNGLDLAAVPVPSLYNVASRLILVSNPAMFPPLGVRGKGWPSNQLYALLVIHACECEDKMKQRIGLLQDSDDALSWDSPHYTLSWHRPFLSQLQKTSQFQSTALPRSAPWTAPEVYRPYRVEEMGTSTSTEEFAKIFGVLLQHGALSAPVGPGGNPLIERFVRKRQWILARRCISSTTQLHLTAESLQPEHPFLHTCLSSKDYYGFEFCLELGFDINAKSPLPAPDPVRVGIFCVAGNIEQSPLHLALLSSDLTPEDVLRVLMHGGDPNLPLEVSGCLSISPLWLTLLFINNATPADEVPSGRFHPNAAGWLRKAIHLVEHGADVNTTSGGLTPLRYALCLLRDALGTVLLREPHEAVYELSAEPWYARGYRGQFAALVPEHITIRLIQRLIRTLLGRDADVNAENGNYSTPLKFLFSLYVSYMGSFHAINDRVGIQECSTSVSVMFSTLIEDFLRHGADPGSCLALLKEWGPSLDPSTTCFTLWYALRANVASPKRTDMESIARENIAEQDATMTLLPSTLKDLLRWVVATAVFQGDIQVIQGFLAAGVDMPALKQGWDPLSQARASLMDLNPGDYRGEYLEDEWRYELHCQLAEDLARTMSPWTSWKRNTHADTPTSDYQVDSPQAPQAGSPQLDPTRMLLADDFELDLAVSARLCEIPKEGDCWGGAWFLDGTWRFELGHTYRSTSGAGEV